MDIWLPFSNVKRVCKARLDDIAGGVRAQPPTRAEHRFKSLAHLVCIEPPHCRVAPQNCKCEKEAYQVVARAATVFISYLTAWSVRPRPPSSSPFVCCAVPNPTRHA